jgi:hypothetical protein
MLTLNRKMSIQSGHRGDVSETRASPSVFESLLAVRFQRRAPRT